MFRAAVLLLLLADEPRSLVDRLRSDLPEEREEAARRLRELGPAALASLQRAATDPGADVAGRARVLLRQNEARREAGPRVAQLFPGFPEILAAAGDPAWTDLYLGLQAMGRYPARLRLSELDLLAVRALRGAATAEERIRVLEKSLRSSLNLTVPEFAKLLRDPDEATCRMVHNGLHWNEWAGGKAK